MTVLRDEKAGFLRQSFRLDCPSLKLSPESSINPGRAYNGPGCIYLNEAGHFEVKLYPPEVILQTEWYSSIPRWKAGEVIDKKYSYKLSGRDIRNRIWEGEGILLDIDSGPGGTLIFGKARHVFYKEDLDFEVNYLKIYYGAPISFSANTYVRTEATVGDQSRGMRQRLSLAKFVSCDIEFEVEEDDGVVTLTAKSQALAFDDKLVHRVVDSFAFVTGNLTPWSILEVGKEKQIMTRFQAHKIEDEPSKIGPPIAVSRAGNEIWLLFEKFLSYGIKNPEQVHHPLGRFTGAVLDCGTSGLEVRALVLSVSVESLLAMCFSEFKHNIDLKSTIQSAKELIKSAIAFDGTFKERLLGLINSMNNPRAVDLLFQLRNRQLLDPTLVRTYLKLRNKSAHGVGIDWAKVQSYLNQCGAVLVLFYQLIFLRIGYTGSYTDYGTNGYPLKKFEVTL